MQKIRPLCLPGLAALVFATSSPVHAATFTWDGGNASNNIWTNGTNWVGDVAPTFDNTLDIIYGAVGADYTAFPVRIQGDRTIRSITFNDDADTHFFTNLSNNAATPAASNLTFDADTGDASITITSGAAGNFGIGDGGFGGAYGNITLSKHLNVVHNGSGTLTINRRILGTGSQNLTKTGTGEMIIELGGASNTFGNTIVAGGRLTLNRTAFAVNTLNGTLGSGTLTIGAASGNAAAELQFGSQGNAFSTAFTVAGGSSGIKSIRIENSGSNNIDISSTITLNDALTVNAVTTGRVTTLSGTLIGSNGLTINAGNQQAVRVDISGNNAATYSGNTTLSRGRTYGRHSNAFGTGTILLGDSGGAFAALYSGNDVTIGNNIIVDGSAAQRRIGNAGFGTDADGATFTGNILLNGTLQVAPDGDASGGTAVTLTGNISGVGGLQIDGAPNRGVLISGNNSYSGSTTVNAGSLQVGSAGVGRTGTGAVTVAGGGTILGSGLVQGQSFTAASGSTVHAGDGTAQSDYGTLTFTPVSGTGTFDFQSGSTIVLGINPGGVSDKLNFIGNGSNTLLFNGNLIVGPSALIPTAAEVFDFIDWSGLTAPPTFASRFTGTTLFGNGDESPGLDLPDISGTGYIWDISSFTTNGSIAIVLVPEPSRMLLLFLGFLAGAAPRRRVLR